MSSKGHPIQNLTSLVKKHNAYSRNNVWKIAAFYIKLVLLEPLRFLEERNYRDAIQSHQLKTDPVFIVGHWRSGTSFLQYVMGSDPQFGYLNKFQPVFPDQFLQSESVLKSLIHQIPESLNIIQDAQNMSVNLDLDSPSEIEIALTTMISPTSLHWGHIFPQDAWIYFNKYLFFDSASKEEIERWKQDYSYLIKKISLKNNGKQLLIKSPGNACRMEKLLELYPDARFIFIHRNPYDVFYSSKKLWSTMLDNLALQNFSEQQMENEIVKVYKKLMSSYLDQRSVIPDGQLTEIRFETFIDEPVEVLRRVYKALGLNEFDKAENHFRKFLKNKEKGSSSSYNYEDDIVRQLNEEWQFAFSEWNYPVLKPTAVSLINS